MHITFLTLYFMLKGTWCLILLSYSLLYIPHTKIASYLSSVNSHG